MKTVTKYENQEVCQECKTILVYDGRDLRWSVNKPDYYYLECPICGERVYLKITDHLKDIFTLAHDPYGNTSYEDLRRERV